MNADDAADMNVEPLWFRTWLRYDDVDCVRCRRWCGWEDDDVYVYKGEGLVCVECHEAAQTDGEACGQ